MPTSRKRRPRHPRPSSTHRPRRESFPSELIPFLEVAARADAAEARGDAAGALDELAAMPVGPDGRPFWRPWRLRRLAQLVAYDAHLPRWATSRWVLDQALQALDCDNRDRILRAVGVARSAGAAALLPAGLDEQEQLCRITDRDWVYRQVYLYELDGLTSFVRTTAAPDLLVAADDLRAWARAEVAAYRFVASTSREVTWEHLASGRTFVVPNLGGAVLVVPGEVVLGRLVPVEGGEMFESAPLRVTETVARDVADGSCWIEALRRAHGDPGEEPIRTGGLSFGLLHDVPPMIWETVLGELGGAGVGPDPRQLATVVLDLARASCGADAPPLLRRDRGAEELDGWPCLAAALLEPDVLGEVRSLVGAGDAAVFEAIADALPEPAAAVCRDVASSGRSAA